MNFSAVILAGGRSSRMGRDKAFVELDGRPLLVRQIELARAAGAKEVLISGRAEVDYTACPASVVPDVFPGAGPLAGVHAALLAARWPLVLVLAVDLPALGVERLRVLTARAGPGRGAIPRVGGAVEPLAAVYAQASAVIAGERLRLGRRVVREFAAACVAAGQAEFVDWPAAEAQYFRNLNQPDDLAAWLPPASVTGTK